jgi:ligand-binding SRPBCC domain-containing protein
MAKNKVDESITVAASPQVVWQLVSEPENYPRWSPEATGITRRSGAGPWQVGDTFMGTNRIWVPWFTICTVTERTDGRRFAFDVDLGPVPIANWAYEVHGEGDTTVVREVWTDRRTGALGGPVKLVGPLVGRGRDAAAHNRASMRATLIALKSAAESSA